ncbi:MAG: alanine dehydrogenase [Chloroflexota bacterium]
MIVGVPKEIKDNEFRVAATPGGVELLVTMGNKVLVETGAGVGSGFTDEEYIRSGAIMVSHEDAFNKADIVLKVKEPQASEFELLREDLVLFTYLHLAAEPEVTKKMLEKKVTGIAYETVEMPDGSLPLLTPMSEVAGRMAVQVAAHYLEQPHGGRGKLLGGVAGVRPSDVVIIGGGTVGINAAQIALGMGAHVTLIDKDLNRLRYLDQVLHGSLTTLSSNPRNIASAVSTADVVIGCVLVPGAKAPRLVTREMIATMKPGSVVIDVAVDQGGCIETSRVTSHSNPTYLVDGVIHYAVPNMPGAVPRTSTYALSNATLPYTIQLVKLGFRDAVRHIPDLAKGVNSYKGKVTCQGVADAFGYECVPLEKLL